MGNQSTIELTHYNIIPYDNNLTEHATQFNITVENIKKILDMVDDGLYEIDYNALLIKVKNATLDMYRKDHIDNNKLQKILNSEELLQYYRKKVMKGLDERYDITKKIKMANTNIVNFSNIKLIFKTKEMADELYKCIKELFGKEYKFTKPIVITGSVFIDITFLYKNLEKFSTMFYIKCGLPLKFLEDFRINNFDFIVSESTRLGSKFFDLIIEEYYDNKYMRPLVQQNTHDHTDHTDHIDDSN
jgi:hypothetical protein